ncbi:MAG TPA: hypothetical protein VGE15_03060 [Sphingobacteriaceae bacterium]
MIFNKMLDSLSGFTRQVILIFGFVLTTAYGSAQTDPLSEITQKFETHRKANLQEKLFVHTDKGFYLAGEIMWFKVYSVDGTFHRPLALSQVCYVEVLNTDNKPVLQAKVQLRDGSGNGSFFLPATLTSDSYLITAYTSWMKNSPEQYFFKKQVTVINSLIAGEKTDRPVKTAYDVQFFPEGGNLVQGIPSKVAFRAVNEEGRGISFQGYVVDQQKDTVSRFAPLRFGIGSMVFTPQPGAAYKAILKLPDGEVIVKDLPAAYPSGYVMSLNEGPDRQVEVNIRSVGMQKDSAVYLFVHTRQQRVLAEKLRLKQGAAHFMINRDFIRGGISHFTVFNQDGKPLAERLYFKRPVQRTVLAASTDQSVYATRKMVTVDLRVPDRTGPGGPADLSMAVYDAGAPAEPAENDIFSYLWLSSDLKGRVESPGSYVYDQSPESEKALDNLMLTHGWRRFRWEDVLSGEPTSVNYLPENQGHIIQGRVIDKRTGAGVEGVVTYLSVPGKRIQLYPSKSGPDGKISFFTRDLYGPGDVVVQTDASKDSSYEVRIDLPFWKPADKPALPLVRSSAVPANWLVNQSVNMQVQNIFSGTRMRDFITPAVDSSAFYGPPDKRYRLADFVKFKTMEEVLREYIVEVVVKRNKGNYFLWVPIIDHDGYVKMKAPSLFLDGVPVFDRGNKIIAFDPAKLEAIEVSEKTSFLGPATFTSIVHFTTQKGDLGGFDLGSNAKIMSYEGLQLNREFYAPKYDLGTGSSAHQPDFRNVLYWSPEIRTDKDGNATVTFYTSDQAGKYKISINGITREGEALSKTIQFEVR